MKTVMGIDMGTQSTKVVLYDFKNKIIAAEASSSHDIISRDDGTKEQKAEWWITALKKCLSEIDSGLKSTVIGIGVSGQQHGFVPLDKNGNVLYNAKLWCDTSTVSECAQITEVFGGEEKLLLEVGNLMLPGYTAPKILWLKNNKPEIYEKLSTILLPHDYLNFYLTGNRVMEYGDASGTGLLDIRKRKWSQTILKAIDSGKDLLLTLPNLISSEQSAGNLKPDIAIELGLNSGIPVSSGGGDNMMGAIGTGTVKSGTLSMSLGTSGTLYGYSEQPIIDKSLAAFCSSTNGWLPLLCTMNCTVSLELTKALFSIDFVELESLISNTPIGSNGLITLPFYNGERAPNLPNGKGCIMGLNMNNMQKNNILRSSMEAAILGMRFGLEAFEKVGFKPAEVRLTGGGTKSHTWRQIAADVLNLPVVIPKIQEAAAFGAALQALWVYDNSKDKQTTIREIVDQHVKLDEDKKHYPHPESVKKYNDVYEEYLKYLNSVESIFK
jgi:xylulokinase